VETVIKTVGITGEMTVTGSNLWMAIQDQAWHIEHGTSPIFDALVAERGDPYREPEIVIKPTVKKHKEVTVEDVERIIKQEKIPTHTRTEEVTIEFAKLRKMTRPQLLSYIATNKELLPKGMKVPNSQARKSELLYVAQHVARGKF
jgi:hypothetical protein